MVPAPKSSCPLAGILIALAVFSVIGEETGAEAQDWKPIKRGLLRSMIRQGAGLHLADAALELSPLRESRKEKDQALTRIAELSERVSDGLSPDSSPMEKIQGLNRVLFLESGFMGTLEPESIEGLSLASLLKERRGTCVTLVILYLSLAELLDLEVSAAATPEHLFVRWESSKGHINIETLQEGTNVPDATYRRRHPMDAASISRGVFMSSLSKQSVIAHLISNRGALALSMGAHEDAEEDLNAALKLFPDLPAAWYNLGLAHLALERPGEARDEFSRSLELHPLDPQALNNRGIAFRLTGNLFSARKDFEAAIRLKPNMNEARENLRRILAEE